MLTADADLDLLEELLHGDGPGCDWPGHAAGDTAPTCSSTVTHRLAQTCNGVGYLACGNAARFVLWVLGRARLTPGACSDCSRSVRRCWHVAPV